MADFGLTCIAAAALAYSVPLPALQGIQAVEGGQPGLAVRNSNGSADLGPFQVNDRTWVGSLSHLLGADAAVVRRTLRDDGCWNAQVAAWILRQEIDAAGGDLGTGIGDYHSRNPAEHQRYRALVANALLRLQARADRTGNPIDPNPVAAWPEGDGAPPPFQPAPHDGRIVPDFEDAPPSERADNFDVETIARPASPAAQAETPSPAPTIILHAAAPARLPGSSALIRHTGRSAGGFRIVYPGATSPVHVRIGTDELRRLRASDRQAAPAEFLSLDTSAATEPR